MPQTWFEPSDQITSSSDRVMTRPKNQRLRYFPNIVHVVHQSHPSLQTRGQIHFSPPSSSLSQTQGALCVCVLPPLTYTHHGRDISLIFISPPYNTSGLQQARANVRTYCTQPKPPSLYSSVVESWAAKLRVCADGGANRVFDEMPQLLPHEDPVQVRKRYKPDVIKGDMDSIRGDVMHFYTELGTKTVDESHDQDTTDLHKCVTFIQDFTPNVDKPNLCILVAGALGGRFDHEMGNINVIVHFSNIRIVLLSDDCLIQLLPKTHYHEIHILSSVEGPHCGLIPIGMPSASTTTTGLRWDLDKTEMKFGDLVSTSNIVQEDKITVQSDSDLLWTISIKKSV